MGTIRPRTKQDGTVVYGAQIVIKRDGKIVHRESTTKPTRKSAEHWIVRREDELSRPGGLRVLAGKTLADAIDKYVETSKKQIGRTKTQVLKTIKNEYDIAEKDCANICAQDLVDFAMELGDRASPATVLNYMSHLGAVFAIAKTAWNMPLDHTMYKDAMAATKRLGITAKAKSRDRRPTIEELNQIIEFFIEKHKRRKQQLPMHHIVPFALFSTRRQEEICTIRWDDLEEGDEPRILVRDMKNPGEKIGNDVWCDLPAPCLDYIKSQPKKGKRIFPYNHKTVSAAFTRACHFLDIDDLRFHDLRHEGTSRLFEMGLNIPHVASATGHRSWSSLKRYTHIRQKGDKYDGWEYWTPPQI